MGWVLMIRKVIPSKSMSFEEYFECPSYGSFFFTCSNFGTYENYHITVNLLMWKLRHVKSSPSQHWTFQLKWIRNLSEDFLRLENSFWIIANPNKPRLKSFSIFSTLPFSCFVPLMEMLSNFTAASFKDTLITLGPIGFESSKCLH